MVALVAIVADRRVFIADDVNAAARSARRRCSASLTLVRVVVLIAIASVVWVPIGVWVGMRPRALAIVQPVAQFLAAFPANLLFPIAVSASSPGSSIPISGSAR